MSGEKTTPGFVRPARPVPGPDQPGSGKRPGSQPPTGESDEIDNAACCEKAKAQQPRVIASECCKQRLEFHVRPRLHKLTVPPRRLCFSTSGHQELVDGPRSSIVVVLDTCFARTSGKMVLQSVVSRERENAAGSQVPPQGHHQKNLYRSRSRCRRTRPRVDKTSSNLPTKVRYVDRATRTTRPLY